MKLHVLLLIALLAFSVRSEAVSDKAKEALKQLEAAMTEEAKATPPKDGENGERTDRENLRAAMIPRLKMLLAKPDFGPNFQENLMQLAAYFRSEAVEKNIATLQEEIRLEQEEQDQAAIDKIQDVLTRAGKAVREAKTTADLDATITELGKFRQRADRGQISDEVRTALYQVEPTLQFATQWQNYLSAISTGNAQEAQEALRNVSNSNQPMLIPRSEILKLLAMPKPVKPVANDPENPAPTEVVEKILAQTKSLDDIGATLKQLRALQPQRNNYGGMDLVNQLSQALQPIERNYQDFKAGLAVNLEMVQNNNYNGGSEVGSAVIARLKADLALLMLPRYVGAPEGEKARPGEDVLHFLDRISSEAKSRGDIAICLRAKEALRLLQRGNSMNGNDTTGLTSLVAAQNQEAAGQYMLAVVSYQAALKSGSDLVPAKLIGERLAAIQSEHQKEFDAGMERVLNPPVPVYNPVSGMPPGMMGRPYGMPNPGADQPPQPQKPALLIPPAPISSPSPEAKATPAEKRKEK